MKMIHLKSCPLLCLAFCVLLKASYYVGSFDIDAVRYSIPLTNNPTDARCMDGSPATYYVRKGFSAGKKNWILFFEGGGWCWDKESCYSRMHMFRGSSVDYPPIYEKEKLREYLSSDPAHNPLLFNWNMVYIRYCDGSSYAGDSQIPYKDTVLYFNGKANRDAIIRSLLREHSLSTADTVLIAGASAGGLGVYLGIDQMAEMIHTVNPAIIVRGMPDSGFFLKFSSKDEEPLEHDALGPHRDDSVVFGHLDYARGMYNVFTMTNMTAGANPSCVRHEEEKFKFRKIITMEPNARDITSNEDKLIVVAPAAECTFAMNLAPHIRTPVMALQSRYDGWQLQHILSNHFSVSSANYFGTKLVRTLVHTLLHHGHPGHGAFIDSCFRHSMSCSKEEDLWAGLHVMSSAEHYTLSSAVLLWLADTGAITQSLLNEVNSSAIWRGSIHRSGQHYEALMNMEGRDSKFDPDLKSSSSAGFAHFYIQEGHYPCTLCCACEPKIFT